MLPRIWEIYNNPSAETQDQWDPTNLTKTANKMNPKLKNNPTACSEFICSAKLW